ncbi:hypothetical protein H9P43_008270 [Blastocladiella emersonii ATCC 22665]|nr:hypothetical protein H9P43_008270 [Blastocladiella emersonii ATCC 22665]
MDPHANPAKLQRLMDWAGLVVPESQALTVQPALSPLGGHGLFAVRHEGASGADFDPALPLASVPRSKLVTARAIFEHAATHDRELHAALDLLVGPPSWSPAAQRTVFVAFLLRHAAASRAGGALYDANPWTPYLDALPQPGSLTSAAFFSEEENVLLYGCAVPRLARAKLANLHAEYQAVLGALVDAREDAPRAEREAGGLDMTELIDFADFMWADAVYWSRVLDVPCFRPEAAARLDGNATELCMIPVLDFANHSYEPTLRWERDARTGDIGMYAVDADAVVPGMELFLCYDPDKSNEELLFAHGFCIPGNTRGRVSVFFDEEIDELVHDNPALAHRVQWVASHLHVQPVLHLAADTPAIVASFGDADRLDLLPKLLAPAPLALVLAIALDDAADFLPTLLHAPPAASPANADEKPGYHASAELTPESAATALLEHARTAGHAVVDRALELLGVVAGRVLAEIDSIALREVARDDQNVTLEVTSGGETVEVHVGIAEFTAASVYRAQVRAVAETLAALAHEEDDE